MREFKFRAWYKQEHRMFYTDSNLIFGFGKIDNPNRIIMQYTGLEDKTGVAIYEGDVVQNDVGEKLKIEYVNLYNCGCCSYDSGIGFNFHDFSNDECVVVGNIYETPELIGELK